MACSVLTECFLVFQEVGLVDYHSHHVRDYSSHLAQPHRRRPTLLTKFQPGNERLVHCVCGLVPLVLTFTSSFSINKQDTSCWTAASEDPVIQNILKSLWVNVSVLGCHFKYSYSAKACWTLCLCNPCIIDIQKPFFCHAIFTTTARKGSFCSFTVLSAALGSQTGVVWLCRLSWGSGRHRLSRDASLWMSVQLTAQI